MFRAAIILGIRKNGDISLQKRHFYSLSKITLCWGSLPIGPATSASSPEKTTSHSVKGPVGSHICTTMGFTTAGISSDNFQFTTSEYGFPAERGLAPRT